ncbi:MAG: FKBP-type peptidyl-prolyl cis-trans isomerase [Flavobacteriales bacterium]|jgi:FKBP-type peptidyl-prolyl cis-trans isomerase FklB|tara:strand:+ start:914 stop:1810 length:897 start_codon:yes stop_codon:yes gene_type:complete
MKRNIILALSASIVLASCVVSKKKLTSTVLAKNNEITAMKDSMNNLTNSMNNKLNQKNLELTAAVSKAEAFSAKSKRQDEILKSKNVQIKQLQNPTSTMKLDNELDKVSYSLGVNIANSLKSQGLESVNSTAFTAALDATFNGTPILIDMEASQTILQEYFGKKQEELTKVASAEGENFLKENASKKGVITTASGLQYEVMTMGTGAKPVLADKVKTHYHGTLLDGTVFDSSVDRGEAISFPLNGVIKGWTEALQLMPVGSKFKLFIPSDLAYGAQGQGTIKPHSALIFEVELLEIEK